MSYAALRPPAFDTNLLAQLELIRQRQFYFAAGGIPIPHIDPRDIGDVAAAALEDDTIQGPITLTGPEALTFSQVAERLSSHLGHRVDYIDATPLDWRAALIQPALRATTPTG